MGRAPKYILEMEKQELPFIETPSDVRNTILQKKLRESVTVIRTILKKMHMYETPKGLEWIDKVGYRNIIFRGFNSIHGVNVFVATNVRSNKSDWNRKRTDPVKYSLELEEYNIPIEAFTNSTWDWSRKVRDLVRAHRKLEVHNDFQKFWEEKEKLEKDFEKSLAELERKVNASELSYQTKVEKEEKLKEKRSVTLKKRKTKDSSVDEAS